MPLKGKTALINCAAGGVAHFAVQLAKWKGAHACRTWAFIRCGYTRVAIDSTFHLQMPETRTNRPWPHPGKDCAYVRVCMKRY